MENIETEDIVFVKAETKMITCKVYAVVTNMNIAKGKNEIMYYQGKVLTSSHKLVSKKKSIKFTPNLVMDVLKKKMVSNAI